MRFLRENKTAIITAVAGLCFMAAGIWRGEIETVLLKAVNICTECIGIG